MGRIKKVALSTGSAMWRAGAFVATRSGRGAGKGSVWVLKKVAVDPAKRKVTNWKLVTNASAVKAMIQNGQCAGCGKAFNNRGGRVEFCSTKCAQNAAETWNEYDTEAVPEQVVGDVKSLYLACGCNRKNTFHGRDCSGGRTGDRVAENVRWSNWNPEHMKPNPEPKQGPQTAREAHYDRVREAQQRDAALPWYRKKKGLNG